MRLSSAEHARRDFDPSGYTILSALMGIARASPASASLLRGSETPFGPQVRSCDYALFGAGNPFVD
jgi:hypothetical protein